jgi:transposase
VDLGFWENVLVAKGYRPVNREQELLLPPNMIEWLPEDHLAWFVIDTVAALDTSVLHARAARRRDGRARRNNAGRAGYDPDMLLTLLIYAYACGERSSRRIERLCATDVAFRVICGQDGPDHAVIARFRQTHAEAFAELFTQVLRLCRAAGLARLGTVAIDGTKIAADASKQATHDQDWFHAAAERTDQAAERAERVLAERVLAEAAEADAAEDALFGDEGGDELPPSWHGRAGRRERIRAALERIAATEAAEAAARRAQEQTRAQRDSAALAAAEAALQVEIDARVAARQRWERQWEHSVTNPGTPLPRGQAPHPPENSASVRRAQARVDKARHRLTHPDTAPRPGRSKTSTSTGSREAGWANLTDPDSTIMPTRNGWVQGYNVQFAVTADQIILATTVSTNPADTVSFTPMLTAAEHAAAALDDQVGTLLLDAGYASEDNLTAPGPDRLIALGKTRSVRQTARERPTNGAPPPGASAREAMDHRLRTPEGAALYTRRGATVEPGIGNFKKLLARFSRRGLEAVTSETHLAATAFNLLKAHRAATA